MRNNKKIYRLIPLVEPQLSFGENSLFIKSKYHDYMLDFNFDSKNLDFSKVNMFDIALWQKLYKNIKGFEHINDISHIKKILMNSDIVTNNIDFIFSSISNKPNEYYIKNGISLCFKFNNDNYYLEHGNKSAVSYLIKRIA